MLKGLDPLLGPDLLHALRAMGHGDEIAIVDGNYPADADAERLIRLDGHGAVRVVSAVLSVMPLDREVDEAVFHPLTAMPQQVHADMTAAVRALEPHAGIAALAGQAFYDRVKSAYCIIATSEPRLYGNIVLRKGVIQPADTR
ncbi:MAG: RbsD/FucU domain-containing protein [Rhizobiaceae bacterium]